MSATNIKTRATTRPGTVGEMREHAGQLFADHYDEVNRHKDLMVLDPDWPAYERLEKAGSLQVIVAEIAGEIVGYSVTFLAPHPHYKGLLAAQNDLLFVSKEHRRSRLGLQLIDETEKLAKAAGAGIMFWHAKEQTALEKLLPMFGYGVHEVIFSKEL